MCATAAQTVEAIDSERDILQAELDSKAETVANLTEELELGHQQADDANRLAALHYSQLCGPCLLGCMVIYMVRWSQLHWESLTPLKPVNSMASRWSGYWPCIHPCSCSLPTRKLNMTEYSPSCLNSRAAIPLFGMNASCQCAMRSETEC